jgi:hypothetical protein
MERQSGGARTPLTPVQPLSGGKSSSPQKSLRNVPEESPGQASKRAFPLQLSEPYSKHKRRSIVGSKNKRVSFGGQQIKIYEQHEYEWHSPPSASPDCGQGMASSVVTPSRGHDTQCNDVGNDGHGEFRAQVNAPGVFRAPLSEDLDIPSDHVFQYPNQLAVMDAATAESLEDDDDNTIQSGSSISEATLAQAAYGIDSYPERTTDDAISLTNEDDSLQYRDRYTASSESLSLFMDEDVTKGIGYPRLSMPLTSMTSLTNSVTGAIHTGGRHSGRRASLCRPPLPRPHRPSRLSIGSWRTPKDSECCTSRAEARRKSFDENITARIPTLSTLVDADLSASSSDQVQAAVEHHCSRPDASSSASPLPPPSSQGKRRYQEEPPRFSSKDNVTQTVTNTMSSSNRDQESSDITQKIPSLHRLLQDDLMRSPSERTEEGEVTTDVNDVGVEETSEFLKEGFSRARDSGLQVIRAESETNTALGDITAQIPKLTSLINEDGDEYESRWIHASSADKENMPREQNCARIENIRPAHLSPTCTVEPRQNLAKPQRTSLHECESDFNEAAPFQSQSLHADRSPKHTVGFHAEYSKQNLARRRSLAADVRRLSTRSRAPHDSPSFEIQSSLAEQQLIQKGRQKHSRMSPLSMPESSEPHELHGSEIASGRLQREDVKSPLPSMHEKSGRKSPHGRELAVLQTQSPSLHPSSQSKNASFKEFLFAGGVRFLDDLSTRRRVTSFGVPSIRACVPSDSLEQQIRVACVTATILNLLQNSCEMLVAESGKLSSNNGSAEAEFQRSWLFSRIIQLHSSGSEQNLLARYQLQLKRLKNVGRLRARLEWYHWRMQHEKRIQMQLATQRAYLQTDLTQLNGLAENLRATAAAAEEDAITSGLGQLSSDKNAIAELRLRNKNDLDELERQGAQIKDARARIEKLDAELRLLSERKTLLANQCAQLRECHEKLNTKLRFLDTAESGALLTELQDTYEIAAAFVNCRLRCLTTSELRLRLGSALDVCCQLSIPSQEIDNTTKLDLRRIQIMSAPCADVYGNSVALETAVARAAAASALALCEQHAETAPNNQACRLQWLRRVVFAAAHASSEIRNLIRSIDLWNGSKPYEIDYREAEQNTGFVSALFSLVRRRVRVQVVLALEASQTSTTGVIIRLKEIIWHLHDNRASSLVQLEEMIAARVQQLASHPGALANGSKHESMSLQQQLESIFDTIHQDLGAMQVGGGE